MRKIFQNLARCLPFKVGENNSLKFQGGGVAKEIGHTGTVLRVLVITQATPQKLSTTVVCNPYYAMAGQRFVCG